MYSVDLGSYYLKRLNIYWSLYWSMYFVENKIINGTQLARNNNQTSPYSSKLCRFVHPHLFLFLSELAFALASKPRHTILIECSNIIMVVQSYAFFFSYTPCRKSQNGHNLNAQLQWECQKRDYHRHTCVQHKWEPGDASVVQIGVWSDWLYSICLVDWVQVIMVHTPPLSRSLWAVKCGANWTHAWKRDNPYWVDYSRLAGYNFKQIHTVFDWGFI